jgi:orotate phosphoribosyltransferase
VASSEDELLGLLAARKGHFPVESGQHGDLWLALDPLFLRPRRLRPLVGDLAGRLSRHGVEGVCGPLVGGAFLAELIAAELDVEFFYAERLATPQTVNYRVPSALRSSVRGRRVVIVDDVIYAGSAVLKTLTDLRECGAVPVGVGALLVLGSAAQRLAAEESLPLERLASLTSGLWAPEACPLCAAQVPLDDPSAGAGASG